MTFRFKGRDINDLFLTDNDITNCFVGQDLVVSGCGNFGSLGDSTVVSRSVPLQLGPPVTWRSVCASAWNTAGLKTDGTLWAWGLNNCGQLGDITLVSKSSPIQVAGTTWKSFSVGWAHIGAIRCEGTLWVWGQNIWGQVGNGVSTTGATSSPTQIAGTDWKIIALGHYHTHAAKTDGSVWGWGKNEFGQVGDSSVVCRSSPVQILASGSGVKKISGGQNHNLLVREDGTLWAWGQNSQGQLGIGNTNSSSSPIQVGSGIDWKSINAGDFFSVGIKTNGTLWTWGWNADGRLGDGLSANRSSPTQTAAGGSNWASASGSTFMSAVKTDGTLWVWGLNTAGALATGDTANTSSPIQTSLGGNGWRSVGSGTGSLRALRIIGETGD